VQGYCTQLTVFRCLYSEFGRASASRDVIESNDAKRVVRERCEMVDHNTVAGDDLLFGLSLSLAYDVNSVGNDGMIAIGRIGLPREFYQRTRHRFSSHVHRWVGRIVWLVTQ
jgi:hypothetical protein